MAASPGQQSKTQDAAHYEDAGAFMLSIQPADPKLEKAPEKKKQDWAKLKGHLEARLIAMRTWRSSWWFQNWADLATYIEPSRSIWLTQSTGGWPTPNNMTRGRSINSAIVDPTGTYAVRTCAAGMMSGLASPSRPWFKVVPSIKNFKIDADGKAWIDEVESRVYTVLAGSNFYNSFSQECTDLVVFGTGPCVIYEDEKDIIRCYNPAVGEYFLSSGSTLRNDVFNRTFVFTISQMVDFFGVENCPADVQGLWKQKGSGLETERIVAHSIEPNFAVGADDLGKIPGKFAWRETYWVFGSSSEKPLSIRGFVEQPFTAGRWMTQSNDAYGRSVGMDVLPDIIQLQVETLALAQGIDKMVNPPLVADIQLKNQPSSSIGGHVTYVNNLGPGTGMRSIYNTNPQVQEMAAQLKEIQERIRKGFFNDIILLLSSNPGDRRTAYEVAALAQERLQVLGPVIENIITESLKPKLKRVFGIMQRRNLLPPVPKSMQDVPVDIEFISMLALAQKASATSGLERLVALIGNMVAVFPEVKDNLDPDIYLSTMNDLLDNPQSILRSQEAVDQLRQQAKEAMERAQQQQTMSQGVEDVHTGAQAAQVLSNTSVGAGQTALSAALGTAGGRGNPS